MNIYSDTRRGARAPSAPWLDPPLQQFQFFFFFASYAIDIHANEFQSTNKGTGPELFCLLLGPPGFNCWYSFASVFQCCCSTPQGSPGVGRNTFFCRVLIFDSSQYLSVIYLFPVMIH